MIVQYVFTRAGGGKVGMATIAEQFSVDHALNKSERKKIIFLICSVLLFSVMNGTMFMIAVPEIAKSFALSPSQVSWVVTGYIIVYAIGALMYGKLADIYPLKNLLSIGLSLFAAGSLTGFFAPSYIMVLVARVIQAAGASSILALVFIVPTRYFPEERSKVLGIISSTMAFASGIGPVIGGVVAGALNWQYLFLISVLVLLAIPFFRTWMPHEETREGKVDLLGAVYIALAVASLILFITMFEWYYIFISIAFFGLFAKRIFTNENPFIRPDLFHNGPFRTTIIAGFFAIMTMFGMMFMLPLMLSEVNGLSTLLIGLTLFPGAMAAAYTGKWAGILTDLRGSKQVVILAFGLMVLGFFLLSSFIGGPAWLIGAVVIISYIAFPFIQTGTATLLSSVLPKNEIGVGMGIYNLFNFMAGAFGGSIIGRMLDYEANVAINPFSMAEGNGIIYSNVFTGLILLTLLNGCFFYSAFRQNNV
jgi:MFS transporter, DHA2 family, metal-tetracycline-proton antiporter